MLRCPVCKAALSRGDRQFSCAQNHSFDIAKEGYVNLLVARKGMARVVGDNAEMIKARRDFLNKGYFNFLASALENVARKALSHAHAPAEQCSILDVGCGEGFFLGGLSRSLTQTTNVPAKYYGMDVSKDAVKMAARTHKECCFFLGSVHHEIPMLDNSVSLITGICAPRNFPEFSRVLSSAGRVVIAIPTPRHLNELRAFFNLLEIEEAKEQKIVEQAKEFELIESVEVEQVFDLPYCDIEAVLTMTPNYWHKTPAKVEISNVQTTFSFRLLSFSPKVPNE